MRPDRPLSLHAGDTRTADVRDKQFLPDLATLSSQPRGCLEGATPIPADVSSLFIKDLWGFDFSLVPEASALYAKLGVPKKPLTLIEPQFEAPTPALVPSVFPPRIPEPPPPTLERFDLDDAFANEAFKAHIIFRSLLLSPFLFLSVLYCCHGLPGLFLDGNMQQVPRSWGAQKQANTETSPVCR